MSKAKKSMIIATLVFLVIAMVAIVVENTKGKEKQNNIAENTEIEDASDDVMEETDLDIFKDLIIEYDAASKKIVLDNSQCSEFIKQNVIFSIKREQDEYNPGDVVVIMGYIDMNAAADNRYNVIATTFEYIVE